MKRFSVMIIVVISVLVCGKAQAQGSIQQTYAELIEPVHIEAAYEQTTNLLFPLAVSSADWGSGGIIVQQRKGAKNILHVKAAKKAFVPTNLSVVTSDGQFYSFVVHYVEEAESLSYLVGKESGAGLATVSWNEAVLEETAERVRRAKSFLHISRQEPSSSIRLQGVYVSRNAIWLKARVRNHSLIDFPVGYVRFFIKDKKVTKRKVVYESELVPVYVDHINNIEGKGYADVIFAFDAFTVPQGKRLIIQVGEDTGGRMLTLKVKPKKILKARAL